MTADISKAAAEKTSQPGDPATSGGTAPPEDNGPALPGHEPVSAPEVAQPKRKRSRRWLVRLVFLAFSLFLAVVAMEVLTRILHLGTGGFWEPHELYGWRNIPDVSGWESCYGECEVFVEINSQGLRDRDIDYTKPVGTRRVLVLGDSLAAGMQVPLEDTFPKVLEMRLNDEIDEPWEVVNGAVNGFGTDNELLFYRHEGDKYDPNVVVLAMYLANDIYNNHRQLELRLGGSDLKPYFTLDENGEMLLHNFPVEGLDSLSLRIGTFLKRNFQLPRAIAQILQLRRNVPDVLRPLAELAGGRRPVENPDPVEEAKPESGAEGQRPPGRADICAQNVAPIIDEAWAVTEAIVRQLNQEVQAAGAQLMVMAIPASPQVTPPEEGQPWYCDRPNQQLGEFLAAEGIPYLDLLPSFREYVLDGQPVPYYERDFHLKSEGHRLAGEALTDFVVEGTQNEG